ncbi:MAG: DUF1538 domain-containing protein [Bacilli bacterium]
MIDNFVKSFKETTIAVVPICLIVTIIALIFGFDTGTISSFIISSILLIIGISLFTFGADISMMMIGEKLGNKLIQSKKIIFILLITLVIGIIITLAEPDLRVLAEQITSIPSTTLILAVSIGVGIFLTLAVAKILFKLSLRTILIICYSLIFVLMFFAPNEFIPISFDSSGVTTGPISVPFILALGIGLTAFRTDSNTKNDTFGLIALCSIGPKLTVLILGLLFSGSNSYDTSIYLNNSPIIIQYVNKFIDCFKEVAISIIPIICLFILLKILFKKDFSKKQTRKIIVGLFATFTGLCLFLTAVNVGFMKTGFLLGESFGHSNLINVLIPFGMIIGFLVVFAEPAIKILTNEVEEITEGSISKNIMKIAISIGVSVAILLSILRVIYQIPITYFLLIGYGLALLLTFIAPKMFTAVSFDAGGSVCGPLTASFILPLVIGLCESLNGNIMLDAFGLIAFIALSPLLTVQLLGIVFKFKTKQEIFKNIDEDIIEYEWRNAL